MSEPQVHQESQECTPDPSPASPRDLSAGWTLAAELGNRTEGLPAEVLHTLRFRPDAFLAELLSSTSSAAGSLRHGLPTRDVGTVRQVGDGVASVWGLPQARMDEILRFSTGSLGVVMNLERDWIDCILLNSDEGIQGGDVVWPTGERFTVPIGDRVLGRVISPLGVLLDDRGVLLNEGRRFIERDALGVVERQAVAEPLHTGIKAIDAIVPVGRGQRELIVGDRQTGKTTMALDTIIHQREQDVVCVYVGIGQKKSSILQVVEALERGDAMDHTVVIMASPDDPPALLYLAPYAGCTIAEYFMDEGRDVLVVYDDLTKHADAYRELSLLLRRPPGREAYPGDIFYLHARLLERACRRSDALGGGSISALPIVETRRGNISSYVPTNLISITDGQIYLNSDLFNQGYRPAVDIGLSVSRVGGIAQTPIMRQISGQLSLTLAQYDEVSHFARFGAEIDRATRQQINRGERLREVLKQRANAPLSLAQQILILYAAVHGHLDNIPVAAVSSFERDLGAFTQREHPDIIRRIEEERQLDDSLAEDLQQLMLDFATQDAPDG